MPTSPTTRVIDQLRKVVLRDSAGFGDGELLGCFIARHDEAAFAALVKRHGPMVWGVCRRLLSHHDAEDAFQATFLVLVRKAASIRPREMVGNWLYGVAHQTALQARRTAARRRAKEVQVTAMPDTEAMQHDHWPDVQPLLDQELSRLPNNYRAVIVLCDLERRTRKEAARQLGVPEGTVAGRLARARAMLAKRLAQRGVALSGGALAAALSQKVLSAGVPLSLVESTITAARLVAAGKAASGAISCTAAALTEGVMKAMLFNKLKSALAVVLILGILATGATILTCRTAAGQDNKKTTAEQPVGPAAKQEKEKEPFTVWGKEVGGVQAGLGFRLGEHRTYHTGEIVTLVVRVRNVGKKEVKFSYFNEFFWENPPKVTDSEGKPIPVEGVELSGLPVLMERKLAPGKEVNVCEWSLQLRPASEKDKERPVWKLFGTGKFQLQHENIGGGNIGTREIKFDPVLNKLATGKLELEIKSEAPSKEAESAKGLKLTLSADKTETRMKPGEDYGALPVKLKLTITNTSDKPIKLNAYALPFRIAFCCEGPSPDSVRKLVVYVDRAGLAPPVDKDFPVVEPGKSWSPNWTPSFPGDIPDGAGKVVGYILRKPGTYKLHMTLYEDMIGADDQKGKNVWLESNELELKVRDKE